MKNYFKKGLTKLRRFFGIPDARSRHESTLSYIMMAIYVAIISASVFAFMNGEWLGVFVSVVAFLVIWITRFVAHRNEFNMPVVIEFLLTLFLYSSLILGEVHGYYTRFWWWDAVLHIGSGVALGFIGFLILYALHRKGRLQAPVFLIVFFAFCFAMALGAMWEIFEFTVDQTIGTNMQKSGLMDTMWDLIVDALGALFSSVSGYLYLKYDIKGTGLMKYYLRSALKD